MPTQRQTAHLDDTATSAIFDVINNAPEQDLHLAEPLEDGEEIIAFQCSLERDSWVRTNTQRMIDITDARSSECSSALIALSGKGDITRASGTTDEVTITYYA